MSALKGIRILELAESVSGEYCGKLLADFGAAVIKLERPGGGSPTRSLGPFAGDEPGIERSGLFTYLNTGKHSVTLSLDDDGAKGTLNQLLAQADAVIDDHDAGWLQGLGLDADSAPVRHPKLIICSITPYGLAPPQERRHAVDLNVFHASGWGYHTPTGVDPARPPLNGPGRFLPSYEAGLEGALCLAAALVDQGKSGLGRFIEISAQAVLASRVDYVLGQMIAGDMDVSTDRSAFDLFGPAGIFPCRDGYIYIWMSAPAHWQGFCELLGNPEWTKGFPANWLERECTPARVAKVREHLVAWLKDQNKHEAAEKAQKLGVTLVAVNNASDLVECEQYAFRGFFKELEHPVTGRARYPTVPYKLSATPAGPSGPAPLLGQHNKAELSSAGAEQ